VKFVLSADHDNTTRRKQETTNINCGESGISQKCPISGKSIIKWRQLNKKKY
jgi:hypothetical protein